jgi:hypothetical protein
MTRKLQVVAVVIASLPLAACMVEEVEVSGAPAVGSASDLSAFEGARAGQAETGIRNLGYEAVRTDGLTTYWFNRSTGACARIVTANGRYQSVTMLPAEDC